MAILKKDKFTVSFFLILIIIGIIALTFLLRSRNKDTVSAPTPTPTTFKLEGSFPPSGDQKNSDARLALQFIFNKPVDTTTTVVSIQPSTSFRLATDASGKTLYISPISEWLYETEYKVIIEAMSTNRETIIPPLEYSFKLSPMSDSMLTE